MANEKRLIDMDDTMNKLRAYADRKHAAGHNDLANGILKAVNYIRNNMVRVDAVEVVRCKECKHWQDIGKGCTDQVRCCEIGFYMIGENGYCYFGEREDNDCTRSY